jgi:predicted SAM-dependent methyltransferase
MQSDTNELKRGDSPNHSTASETKTQPAGLKLNLGCGFDIRAGYVNIDANDEHHPDLVSDVANLSALADGVAIEALAQDVLEHLPRETLHNSPICVLDVSPG